MLKVILLVAALTASGYAGVSASCRVVNKNITV